MATPCTKKNKLILSLQLFKIHDAPQFKLNHPNFWEYVHAENELSDVIVHQFISNFQASKVICGIATNFDSSKVIGGTNTNSKNIWIKCLALNIIIINRIPINDLSSLKSKLPFLADYDINNSNDAVVFVVSRAKNYKSYKSVKTETKLNSRTKSRSTKLISGTKLRPIDLCSNNEPKNKRLKLSNSNNDNQYHMHYFHKKTTIIIHIQCIVHTVINVCMLIMTLKEIFLHDYIDNLKYI